LTGAAARAELEAAGLTDRTVSIAEASRTTLVVVEADGGVTGFSERGPRVSGEEWQRMLEQFQSLLGRAEAVVLAGSLPRVRDAGEIRVRRPVRVDRAAERAWHRGAS
jgi:tagatose 6-phosphate kinase